MTTESIPVPRLPSGLDTPALAIDLDIAESNAERMAATMTALGVALRPHTKTHKSIALARIQQAAAPGGITVGTLGEAEVMAEAGFDDIFIAYPLWAAGPKGERLRALHGRAGLRLKVGFDSVLGAEQLAAAVAGIDRPLVVLLEIDPGYHRTGVPPADAGTLASAAAHIGLAVQGVFTHGGHAYAGRDAVDSAAADEVAALDAAIASLAVAELEARVISAGSTPTAVAAATAPVNEIRPGTYLLGDRIEVALGGSSPEGVAIAIVATVVSTAAPGTVVIDAGAKTLTKDLPPYLDGYGFLPAYPDAYIERLSDYHGVVRIPEGTPTPRLGEVVAVIPNHACPVVDLHDRFVAHRSGSIVGLWPVDARGRSR
ncbi:MAG TPA: alanine racemase [Candidatus Limnocylindrales bacterium]|nr:alanine racemase [Candidatus Limnocylindrales bacterium]